MIAALSRITVETRVLSVVREQLLSPVAIVQMQECRCRTAFGLRWPRARETAHASPRRSMHDIWPRPGNRASGRRGREHRNVGGTAPALARCRKRTRNAQIERRQRGHSEAGTSDLIARYRRAVTDLRGSLNRYPGARAKSCVSCSAKFTCSQKARRFMRN